MALFPLQPGIQPLGQFDVLDSQLTSIKGGEVMTFASASRVNTASEKAAADVLDGYDYDSTGTGLGGRAVAQLAATAAEYPLALADDGNSPDYLTYFGQVVGGPVGLSTTGGTKLGPHTAEGSGKVTLWDKPGLFAVTVDALAATFVSSLPSTGLAPGSTLGFTAAGLLAHGSSSAVSSTGCATFLEFESSPSLVTTPGRLVSAAEQFTRAKVWFHGGLGNRTVTTP